ELLVGHALQRFAERRPRARGVLDDLCRRAVLGGGIDQRVLLVVLCRLGWWLRTGAHRFQDLGASVAPPREVRELVLGVPAAFGVGGLIHADRDELGFAGLGFVDRAQQLLLQLGTRSLIRSRSCTSSSVVFLIRA